MYPIPKQSTLFHYYYYQRKMNAFIETENVFFIFFPEKLRTLVKKAGTLIYIFFKNNQALAI